MKKLTPKICKTVRLVYGWIFAVYTAVVGALFIWQALDIYVGGQKAGLSSSYSYDLVAERISHVLAIPFFIWLAAIIIGFILWEIFHVEEKVTPITDARYVLYRLNKRVPDKAEGELKSSLEFINKEKKKLRILHGCLLALVAAYVVYICVYMSIPSNFPNVSKTSDMLNMVKFIMPVGVVVYAAACVYVIFLIKSAKKQLPHVKKLTAGVKAPKAVKQNIFTSIVSHKYFILGVRIAVACVGVAFVIAGCLNGSILEVFGKAIRICTECIGLG